VRIVKQKSKELDYSISKCNSRLPRKKQRQSKNDKRKK